ncbi:MAG: hypothetical protein KJ043_14520, partial [Anaerolineae bacterium]|nr:hypothetical protein [Anaerolineae bacterium]
MKFIRFLMLVVILALPMLVVNAQEESAEEVWIGSYVLSANSGTFEETDDDGVFTLVLNDVSQYAPYVVNLPALYSGLLTTQDLIAFWTFQPELVATAVLTTENESVYVSLALADDLAYDIDNESLSFVATVTSVVPFDPEVDASKAEAPEEFDVVTLFINMDAEFAEAIALGAEARSEGTRDTNSSTCTPRPG